MILQIKKHYLIIFFLIFYFCITSYKFIKYPTPFYDWDEAIYVQVGREMVQAKSLVPLWQGKYWLDKPPLAPLAYGIVETTIPLQPELSTRIFTLLLSIIALSFCYIFYYRLTKDKIVSTLTIILTSFTPVFLQRSQVLNVDIFLLLGWFGYVIFFNNFWLSLLFMAIGVLSKSLLGFYPAIIFTLYFIWLLIIKKINWQQFKKNITPIIIQVGILSIWYILMLIFFKYEFIKAQFLESQLKRVTASIESHFGKRTFYFDLLIEQFQPLSIFIIFGGLLILWNYWKKKNIENLINSLFFVPWFIFLNLTKTKISWYIYHVLPQFALLINYPLSLIKNIKIVYYGLALLIIALICNNNLLNNSFYNSHYSTYDQNYYLATYAKDNCQQLTVLIDPDSRKTHDTLQAMNLLISTSVWWGNHPAYVYYFGKHLDFIYDKQSLAIKIYQFRSNQCLVIDKNDLDLKPEKANLKLLKTFDSLYLYKR